MTSDRMTKLVFGHDVKFDENGQPIEKGSGSKHAIANHKPANWPLDPKTAHAAVFGAVDVDKDGKPIERGIKAPNQPNKTE